MKEKVLMDKVEWGKKDQEHWRRRLDRNVIVIEHWHPEKTQKEGMNKLWGHLIQMKGPVSAKALR